MKFRCLLLIYFVALLLAAPAFAIPFPGKVKEPRQRLFLTIGLRGMIRNNDRLTVPVGLNFMVDQRLVGGCFVGWGFDLQVFRWKFNSGPYFQHPNYEGVFLLPNAHITQRLIHARSFELFAQMAAGPQLGTIFNKDEWGGHVCLAVRPALFFKVTKSAGGFIAYNWNYGNDAYDPDFITFTTAREMNSIQIGAVTDLE